MKKITGHHEDRTGITIQRMENRFKIILHVLKNLSVSPIRCNENITPAGKMKY